MRPIFFYTGVFLISCSTLMLEIIQTRILSVVVWYHLAFFVISLAMFGLTAGAVWVYLNHVRFTEKTLSYDLSYFSALSCRTNDTGADRYQAGSDSLDLGRACHLCVRPFFLFWCDNEPCTNPQSVSDRTRLWS